MDQTNLQPPQPAQNNFFSPKNLLPLIVFSVVLIVLTSSITYLVFQSRQTLLTFIQPTVIPTHQPFPSPTSPPAETANWKTYTSKYRYSFKYPPAGEEKTSNWKEGNIDFDLQQDDEGIIRFSEPNQPSHGGFPYGISISLKIPKENPQNLTAKQWAITTISKEINPKISDLFISNISAAKVETIFEGNNTIIFIPNRNKMYTIYFKSFSSKEAPAPNYTNTYDYEKLFDQILSTFRFLDQNYSSTNHNLKTFSSQTLGISFTYLEKQGQETILVKEMGNKVYIYTSTSQPTSGQFVEVFQKSPAETLGQAITKQFLSGKPPDQCFVKDYKLMGFAANFVTVEISYLTDQNDNFETMDQKSNNCSPNYAASNGIRYFLQDKNYPSKFLFFNIGQYAIDSENNTTWQNTIKLLQ